METKTTTVTVASQSIPGRHHTITIIHSPYTVTIRCTCPAATRGVACWHRALTARVLVADGDAVWNRGALYSALDARTKQHERFLAAADRVEPAWVAHALRRPRKVRVVAKESAVEVCDTCKAPTGFTTRSTRPVTCDGCYSAQFNALVA